MLRDQQFRASAQWFHRPGFNSQSRYNHECPGILPGIKYGTLGIIQQYLYPMIMHEPQFGQLNHDSSVQSGAEHGLLILLGSPLNCIGYWTMSIFIVVVSNLDIINYIVPRKYFSSNKRPIIYILKSEAFISRKCSNSNTRLN